MGSIDKRYYVEEFVTDGGWTERYLRNEAADSVGADYNLRYWIIVRQSLWEAMSKINIPVAIVLS